ncbi:MAG: DUF1538 domain-containing protein, partial [Bacteroidales bacterium]|nr:DUF1538 domain-containing protein [Bacteroidales bacterium]
SLFSKGSLSYDIPDYSMESVLEHGVGAQFLETMLEVGKSLLLIVVFFLLLQAFILKLPKHELISIAIGILLTFLGLAIFLTAVAVGFMPVGYKLGTQIAAFDKNILVILSFVLGCVVVLAEPAVHVLNQQVEEITNGQVTRRQMVIALSVGVGLSIGLSILRIIYGFSLLYYLIPGYLLSLGLSFFVPRLYTAIAFDSGGVASGPLTSSFILPMAIGACVVLQSSSEVLSLGFGIVAMVAMTPLITIQALGFRGVVTARKRERAAMQRILSTDDEQIIYFE